MQQAFYEIMVKTKGQGLYNFTDQTLNWLKKQQIKNGILNINVLHTSASLVIQENADPDVLYDLKKFFDKLAPMDNKLYKHTTEGKDDMPAHIKSVLTNNQLTLSLKNKQLVPQSRNLKIVTSLKCFFYNSIINGIPSKNH